MSAEAKPQTARSAALLQPGGDLAAAAARLAARFGLALTERGAAGDLVLHLEPWAGPPGYRLHLEALGPGTPGPVAVEFVAGAAGHRRRFGGGRGQPLARAVGLKGREALSVVDLTAGLGRDGFVLASLGAQVWLVERNAALVALLDNGIARAAADPDTAAIAARLHLILADGRTWLEQRSVAERPDVVYLDPMYPERRKRALVKKEMRLLRQLVGDDLDAPQLLAAALGCARRRVVVKRPRTAPPLPGPAPAATIASPNTRYDVYL